MKGKKKKGWLLIMLLLLAAGTATALWYEKGQREAQAEEAGQSSVEAGEGQSIVYGEIDTIIGNEITIKLLEMTGEEDHREYKESGEQKVYRIPVGTEVETRLGSITTFSRLNGNDRIALLFEGDEDAENILKIWIIGW